MVYVHLATGFEEVEALTCVDVLRRADIEVKTVSVTGDKSVDGTHGVKVEADTLFEEADYEQCEMIVLPGGLPGATNLRDHQGLKAEILKFGRKIEKAIEEGNKTSGKKLAAICAAPLVLADHGLLEGKLATIYPGMEDCLRGAKATDEKVTVCGDTITGMGPALAMEFALTLVEELKGKDARKGVEEGLLIHRM